MNLISAKCPNCGANIKVDGESKTGRCEFCGAEYITQDVINQYSVNNHYSTVQYVTKNMAGGTGLEAEEYIRNGDVFISLNMYDKAKKAYSQAIELNPGDWRGWFGMVKVCTKNFTDYEDISHIGYYENAEKVASPEQREEIEKLYTTYLENCDVKEKEERIARERFLKEEQQRKEQQKREEQKRIKQIEMEEERRRKEMQPLWNKTKTILAVSVGGGILLMIILAVVL